MPEWIATIFTPDWITAIGVILTPLAVAFFGYRWSRQNQAAERQAAIDRQMQADRIAVYQELLKPFMIMFMNDTAWASAQARNRAYKNKTKEAVVQDLMWSEDWILNSFRLTLIGSDASVQAFNRLLDTARSQEGQSTANPKQRVELVANLLLEIRRSAGNEQTGLENWDMLKPFITDLDAYLRVDEPTQ